MTTGVIDGKLWTALQQATAVLDRCRKQVQEDKELLKEHTKGLDLAEAELDRLLHGELGLFDEGQP